VELQSTFGGGELGTRRRLRFLGGLSAARELDEHAIRLGQPRTSASLRLLPARLREMKSG
jgi:hypothetical protein